MLSKFIDPQICVVAAVLVISISIVLLQGGRAELQQTAFDESIARKLKPFSHNVATPLVLFGNFGCYRELYS